MIFTPRRFKEKAAWMPVIACLAIVGPVRLMRAMGATHRIEQAEKRARAEARRREIKEAFRR